MAEATDVPALDVPPRRKRGLIGLIVGLMAALALGGGSFYALYSGLIDPMAMLSRPANAPSALSDTAFIAMEPITISLPPGSSARHLRFTGQLEVDPKKEGEVVQLMPRILDVLNTYLRAVEVRDLEQPASIPRLRAQMLRRIQVVTGDGRVRDLLITEFILN